MSNVSKGRLGLFLGVLTFLAALFLAISSFTGVSMVALAPAYMFTPLAAGLGVCLAHRISLRDVGLRTGRPRWLVASALVALPLVVLTLALAIAAPGITFDPMAEPLPGVEWPAGLPGVAAAFALVVALGTTVNALFALGEEFGWRGYLLWELAPLGFWKASGAVGVIWGIWHAPVIIEGYNFPSFPMIGVGVMTIACVAFSPLYTYLVFRSGSVLAAALLHGVFNGSAGMVLVYTTAEDAVLADFVANPVGGAGIVAFGLVALLIAALGAPSLTRTFASPARAVSPRPDQPARRHHDPG